MEANIIRTGRVVLHVADLDRSRKFYVDALGLIETETRGDELYLRGLEEHNHHSIVLKKSSEPRVEVISYKVMSDSDLDRLEELFNAKGMKTKWLEKGSQHAVGRTLRTQDPSGMPVEFYAEMDTVERMLQRYDLYKGARIQRIDHFNCMVRDVEKAYHFYIDELGFACSEYTAAEDERIWAAWLHRKPSVHDVAFMNGKGPRLHHTGFWLSDQLSLIHACDVLASMGYTQNIERGPGRHGLSNAFFLYLRDPDGHRIELYNGDYLTSDPDFKPVRWDINDPRRQTFWGHAAPDSWFEEASEVMNLFAEEDETVMEIGEPTLKQRKPTFVI
ncbi:3,4-dihydroxyphenylacetate 2,3-dioxygenase [Alteribacter lacisalsi]|uniref:3,4-dihydroxyphenylacetate 2,3-dioxygenase n=1 Tax=Alteribacter lacisalsi TaxID=2045244 RepID=A0A2W0H5Y8_9BACI|nr:3,4-dihydroxyphenylacetate 2,3-dioxygenase [Alteribacter lacisalsi]PYZ96527.1 3,4-dihydroxyphenylacetate 2,3-dioxygenase [Alteribacter lacisalsi]